LARLGAETIIVGRNDIRAYALIDEVRAETPTSQLFFMSADLSRQAEIRRLADRILRRWSRIDVLINNAGGIFGRRNVTADGIEATLALNHLAPFLLTHLLLPALRAAAPGRIVTVSSVAHAKARLNLKDMEGEQHYSGWQAYRQSKLANLLFTYELARRLPAQEVTVNALHPGFVATEIGDANGLMPRFLWKIIRRFGRTPAEGARTVLYLASTPEVAGISGRYFVDCRPAVSSSLSNDRDAALALWQWSEERTRLARIGARVVSKTS
jgi:NAD(P)-dependent dehydrogenase (short-subunit alcohol dehydrogenase family)